MAIGSRGSTETYLIFYFLLFCFRRKIFEEERIKILRTHADDLLGFLPPGLLHGINEDVGE